jgi:hypothetical protein
LLADSWAQQGWLADRISLSVFTQIDEVSKRENKIDLFYILVRVFGASYSGAAANVLSSTISHTEDE